MRNRLLLFVAPLLLALPCLAQTAPLGQFVQIPPLDTGEVVIGLTTLNSQLALVTSTELFVSPLAPTTGQITYTRIAFRNFNANLTPDSHVTNNPANANEIWATGGGDRAGNLLYKMQIDLPNHFITNIIVPLPGTAPIQSLASDGSAAYIVSNGHVLKIDATSGATLFDLDPSNFTGVPQYAELGPDGLLYVLDSSTTTARVVSFDTNGNFKGSFSLQPSTSHFGPLAISSIGQLFSPSTDSSGALSLDSYETLTGSFLGSTSGATTFSLDQGINPGSFPVMFANNGYLYFTTGTGQYVWLFSTGPRTPAALACHGSTISEMAHEYGSTAAAAKALGYPSVSALQTAIRVVCGT